jgi:hypothetical protein
MMGAMPGMPGVPPGAPVPDDNGARDEVPDGVPDGVPAGIGET